MENYQLKLNMLKFNNAFVLAIDGKSSTKQCVCIPIEDNHLFITADENLKAKAAYADININQYEGGKSQYGDTHYARLAVPKEVRENMTDEEKKAIPYLGNMKPSQVTAPQSAEVATPVYSTPAEVKDDLPF